MVFHGDLNNALISGLLEHSTRNGNVDTGGGPYLATSNASPGFGYYFRSKELNEVVSVVSGATAATAGDVERQHFVVNGDKPNSASDMYEYCVTDSNPYLFTSDALDVSDASTFHLYASAGYPGLTDNNFLYNTTSSGDPVVIPSNNVILGYVNKALEIAGIITVSGAVETATELKSAGVLTVNRNNPSQDCGLEAIDGTNLEYSCLIPYEWTGDITLSVSGAFSVLGVSQYNVTTAVTSSVSSGSNTYDFVVEKN